MLAFSQLLCSRAVVVRPSVVPARRQATTTTMAAAAAAAAATPAAANAATAVVKRGPTPRRVRLRISPETARRRILWQDINAVQKNLRNWFDQQRRMREVTEFEQRLQFQKERAKRRAEHQLRVMEAARIRAEAEAPKLAEQERKRVLGAEYAKRRAAILTEARREWLTALQRCVDMGMSWTVSPDEWRNRRYSPELHDHKEYPWHYGTN